MSMRKELDLLRAQITTVEILNQMLVTEILRLLIPLCDPDDVVAYAKKTDKILERVQALRGMDFDELQNLIVELTRERQQEFACG